MASVYTNLMSLNTQRNLGTSQSSLATAMERLSSGLRINGAKDDAAGQGIGNRMSSQITGLAQAQRNANDGVSLSQTAHGALDQINERLHRIRELTVQGESGALTLRDTDIIQAEINENLKEIDRLAASANYNGIPLLNGRAGEVGLQVGANDGDEIAIDLAPPGFSVEALGLDEFTIAGIDGEVNHRGELIGRALDIHLDDNRTDVLFPNIPGSDRDFKRMPSGTTGDGPYGYYVSATSGGQPVFYDTDYPVAEHDTASDTSTVTVTSNYRIYNQADNLAASALTSGNISITDTSGNAFIDSASRQVVKHGTAYLVEETDASGIVRHYEAELDFTVNESSPNATAMVVRQASTPLPGLTPPPPAIESGTVDSHDLDAADTLEYVDGAGNPLTDGKLVEIEGDYYLSATESGSGDTVYYALNDTQETTAAGPPATTTLIFTADTTRGLLDPGLANSTSSNISTPSFSLSGKSVTLLNDNGDPLNGATRLMERNDPGYQGEYVIEVDEGAGVYSYYRAELTITTDSSGFPTALSAQASEANPYATFRTDEADTHNVKTVQGTSTVTIDPRNVEVNYTDYNGETYTDVLRAGSVGDSNYYFDLPNSQSAYGNFKIASLVDTENNDILIKTINGNGEVIIYHPSNLNSTYNVSVTTDANGFDNGENITDGIPHTIINIVESAQEIRLKKPSNPLAALDRAISHVDSKRSHLGAMENRLASAIESQENTRTNLASARSRIMDANYAVEIANMTRSQILQQAGTTILAQANQVPQTVLSLLNS